MYAMMFGPVVRRMFLHIKTNVTSHFNFQNKSFGAKQISVCLSHSLTLIRNNATSSGLIMEKPPKYLAAFDFDHTIVNDNSDIVARDLIPKSFTIPDEVKILYSSENGWTQYMAEIFKILHNLNVSKDEIVAAITAIPQVAGTAELFRNLVEMNFEIIIISDSNMEFIRTWCEANGVTKLIDTVYSNPANFDEQGLLTIQPFHRQTTCSMSQMNLCKGQVLDEHIARKATDGINFEKVFYVGDGNNDYCPITRLRTEDFGCARVGYKLAKLLAESTIVKAEIVLWENGNDLLKQIKEKI